MGIGKKLQKILQEKDMSVAELARRTGISAGVLRTAICRDSGIKATNLIKIIKVLDISPYRLIDSPKEMIPVGTKVKEERIIARCSIETLSEKTGIDKDVLIKYEQSQTIPLEDLKKLIIALNYNFIPYQREYEMNEKINSYLFGESTSIQKDNDILSIFNCLNDEGKHIAIERLKEMTQLEQYTKNIE